MENYKRSNYRGDDATGSDIVKGDLSVVYAGMYYINNDDDLLEISYPLSVPQLHQIKTYFRNMFFNKTCRLKYWIYQLDVG